MGKIMELNTLYGPEPYKVWLGTSFAVVIIKPEDVQVCKYLSLKNKKQLKNKILSALFGILQHHKCFFVRICGNDTNA